MAEALHQQLSKKEPVYKELERPRREGKRKKRGSRPQPIIIGAKRTWSAALSLVLVTALLLAFSIGVGATGGSHYGTEGLQAIQQVEVVGAALHGIPFSFTGSRSSSHLGYGTGQASALAAVDGYSFDGYLAATAHESYEKDPEGGWIWGNAREFDPALKAQLQATVREHKGSAFAYSMDELPGYCGDMGPFRLNLTTAKPVIQSPRRYSPKETEIIREKTAELLKPGICVEWTGPTLAAVNPVIAAKKDEATGLWTAARMAQDYRPVNKVTEPDKYGLHRPEDIFQRVGKARFFSKLDMRQGFLQIPIHPEDQGKTAFWCGNRLIAYTRMPYGLKNASAAFQRRMDYELRKAGLDQWAVAFIDDLLIATDTAEEHVEVVSRVLDVLNACGLRAHPDKSIFGADVVEYLGHNLSSFGISPHHAKVAAILALPPPKNVSELRTQLGFINYYRCYIPRMSELAAPLNHLLKAGVPWRWGPEQERAHASLKEIVSRPDVVLRRIDYSKQLILHTDFSNRGIAAVLGQLDDNGNEYMCASISRSLNKHESNYSSYKGEMLAAVWAMKMFRHHLVGSDEPFRLVTDHQPLLYLMSSEGLTGQYARFALVLQEYNFTVEHRPGVLHQNADVLSRHPVPSTIDGSGARIDVDTAEVTVTPAALASSAKACEVRSVALASAHRVASFSEDFLPSPEEMVSGWNGWAYEAAFPPPNDPAEDVRVERDRLHSVAREWSAARRLRRQAAATATSPSSSSPQSASAATWYDQAFRHGVVLYEPLGGLASGLEACLRSGIPVHSYLYSDINDQARGLVERRCQQLSDRHVDLLPPTAWSSALVSLPQNVSKVSTADLLAVAPGSLPVLIVAYWEPADVGAQQAVLRIVQQAQAALGSERVKFCCGGAVRTAPAPIEEQRQADSAVSEAWGRPVLVDAARLGSGVHQLYRAWTNLADVELLKETLSSATRPAGPGVQQHLGVNRVAPVTQQQLRAPYYASEAQGQLVNAVMHAAVSADSTSSAPSAACPVRDLRTGEYTSLRPEESEALLGLMPGTSDSPRLNSQQRRALLSGVTDVTYLASLITVCSVLAVEGASGLPSQVATVAVTVPLQQGSFCTALSQRGQAAPNEFVVFATGALDPEGAAKAGSATEPWTDQGLLSLLQTGHLPQGLSEVEVRRVRQRAQRYRWQGQQLYVLGLDGRARIVPRPAERGELILKMHEQSGHWGVKRTVALLLHSYWWRGINSDVAETVRHCAACSRVRATFNSRPGVLNPLPIGGLFYRWGLDLCGPFNKTAQGSRYVMVCVEHFSKFVVLIPLPSKHAVETAFAFRQHILGRYGACAEVCTDQGSEWKGEFASCLQEALIDHRQTSANHPQANGLSERAVRSVKEALTKMANASGGYANWDEQLPSIMLGYNCSVQGSTKLCPYTIVHAVDPVIPPAIKDRFGPELNLDDPEGVARSVLVRAAAVRKHMAMAGGNLSIAQHRDRLRYARLRGGGLDPALRKVDIGDYVYYRNATSTSSLEANARPEILRVVETRPSGVVVLEGKCGGRLTAHVTHVAPCHLPITDDQLDPRLAKPPLTLACEVCRMPDSEEWMLLCDSCGTGWHTYCLRPPLEGIPQGTWICGGCERKGVTVKQVEARSAPRAPSLLHPPPSLARFQGAFAMRAHRRGRSRSKAEAGVVMYAGKHGNVHHFTVEYPDKTSELVSLRELRPRLMVPGAPEPAATASALQPAPSVIIDISVASTASEREALAEVIDLGGALSVFAPLGLSEQTAVWARRQGCTLRHGVPGVGPAALSTEELTRAGKSGVNMGVIWLEGLVSEVRQVADVAVVHAREAVIIRVCREYLWNAGEARLRWLRTRQAEGRLLILPCVTCVWLVLMAGGERRRGFIRCSAGPVPLF